MIIKDKELSADNIDDALADAGIIHAERTINGVSLIIADRNGEPNVLEIVGNPLVSVKLTPISSE